MNAFENVVIGVLQGVETDAPLFINSARGNLLLNASETLLASILARFVPAPAPAPVPTPPVSSN